MDQNLKGIHKKGSEPFLEISEKGSDPFLWG